VIVEQVHLVNIEQPAVDLGQQPWLEAALAFGDGVLEVEGAHDAILGGGDRELDKARGTAMGRERAISPASLAGSTEAGRPIRLTRVGAAVDNRDRGEQTGETADGGRLRRALLATNENAADARVDRVEDQGALEALLADNCGEWIDWAHDRNAHDNKNLPARGEPEVLAATPVLSSCKKHTNDDEPPDVPWPAR
jgi:hypothetical protein